MSKPLSEQQTRVGGVGVPAVVGDPILFCCRLLQNSVLHTVCALCSQQLFRKVFLVYYSC